MKELNDFRKFIQENELHEGTWSLGSVERMETLIATLTAISQNDNLGLMKAQLEKLDNSLYRVFGDDDFSDKKDAALGYLEDGDLDRFRNSMSDAIDRAKDMLAYQKGSENLEENDVALDEIIGEEKEEIKEGLFDEIDMMMDKLAVHMSAEETLRDLMGEFEAISGGPKVLHMALKNLMMGAGLMEEKDEE